MKKIGFIYPQWMQAKRTLIDRLENSPPHKISQIVEDFFKNHLFEYSASVTTHRHFNRPDIMTDEQQLAYEKRQVLSMIVDNLLKADLFVRETRVDTPLKLERSFTILALGCPDFIGPGTREREWEG